MGAVHAGVQEPLGRPVAIKVLRAEVSERADVAARFKREAEVAASLSHPNIAQVTDFGVENGRAFIVMDLLEGESLASLIEHEGRLSEARVQRIAMQVLTALAVAHERGVVHRDLKPENIFVQQVGSMELVKLLDFGIARIVESDHAMTNTGAVLGTPAYMSPEQARGKRVDARSDVFSIGGVLYEMLAGRRPFAGENYHELMFKVVEETPTPLAQLDPEISPALATLVERAMNKTPEARFPSATEMREALSLVTGLREVAPASPRSIAATRDGSAEALANTMASEPSAPRVAVGSDPFLPTMAADAATGPIPGTTAPIPAAAAPAPARGLLAVMIGAPVAVLLAMFGTWAVMRGDPAASIPAIAALPAVVVDAGTPMRPMGAEPPVVAPAVVVAPEAEVEREGEIEAEAEAVAAEAEAALPSVPPPAPHPSHARPTGWVTVRCGAHQDEMQLPIVGPHDAVTATSLNPQTPIPRGTGTGIRMAVTTQASSALTACYRGHPISQGQDYEIEVAADGTVVRATPRVFCPLDAHIDACARRALGEVVFPNEAATAFTVRVGLSIPRD